MQEVGLVLNASKTFVLTTEAQPPTSLRLQNGAEVSVLPRGCGHKWLGCFLTTKNVQGPTVDVEHHLQALLRHGSCTSGCCATRTFRWVYA